MADAVKNAGKEAKPLSNLFSNQRLNKIANKVFTKRNALIGVSVAVVAAVAGAVATFIRSDKKEEVQSDLSQENPVMMDSVPGPATGYGQNQWQNYVQAGRGGRGMNAANPRMNVGDAQDLGNIRG